MRPAQKEYFIRTLELCAERGLPVVLVSHFSPHQSDRARHAAFARYVDSVARAHDVRYLDFAYTHTLSDTDHFYDHNHLNEAGANIFNERLVDSLAKHGLLPMR